MVNSSKSYFLRKCAQQAHRQLATYERTRTRAHGKRSHACMPKHNRMHAHAHARTRACTHSQSHTRTHSHICERTGDPLTRTHAHMHVYAHVRAQARTMHTIGMANMRPRRTAHATRHKHMRTQTHARHARTHHTRKHANAHTHARAPTQQNLTSHACTPRAGCRAPHARRCTPRAACCTPQPHPSTSARPLPHAQARCQAGKQHAFLHKNDRTKLIAPSLAYMSYAHMIVVLWFGLFDFVVLLSVACVCMRSTCSN